MPHDILIYVYLNSCDDKLQQGEVFINHDQGTNIIADCTFGFQVEGKLTRFSIFISLWLGYIAQGILVVNIKYVLMYCALIET